MTKEEYIRTYGCDCDTSFISEIAFDKLWEDYQKLKEENEKVREGLDLLLSIVGLTAFKYEAQREVLQDACDRGNEALGRAPRTRA